MLTFWGIVVAATMIGGLPAVSGLWIFERSRSRRRNADGCCAACGTAWQEKPDTTPHLVHGRLVCADCARTARRRMPWHFGLLGLGAGAATFGVVASQGLVAMIAFPAVSMAVMAVGAVQLMRAANRRAEREIAHGRYPAIKAVYQIQPTTKAIPE